MIVAEIPQTRIEVNLCVPFISLRYGEVLIRKRQRDRKDRFLAAMVRRGEKAIDNSTNLCTLESDIVTMISRITRANFPKTRVEDLRGLIKIGMVISSRF